MSFVSGSFSDFLQSILLSYLLEYILFDQCTTQFKIIIVFTYPYVFSLFVQELRVSARRVM